MRQQASPWVLSKVARAQYDLLSYEESKLSFQVLREVAPSWMEDLEVYSTVLWHLKDEVTLACLAHDLTSTHFLSPQTWCAVGNSFSLQRLRNEAIKCFRRACQLSPSLAQAYSLLGYEYLEIDDHIQAARSFQQALQVDSRHYLAWVGLGRVQEKLGHGSKALKYYLSANKINSSNPLLMSYIARAFEMTGQHQNALTYLLRGMELNPPKTTICLIKMQSAALYLRMGEPAKALHDLKLLQQLAPEDPRVHFLLGQAYATSGQGSRGAAISSYTVALSLAPGNEEIKSALEALEAAP